MYGLKERKWWLFALALFTVSWWNFDYSGTGIQLMLIFYLCRNRLRLGAASTSSAIFRPDERLAGGSPVPDGGRPLHRLVHFRRVRRAPDLLRHALPHQDQPLVLLRLLSRPSGGHRPGGNIL
ncbi:MAG: hypothetical protein ACLTYN_07860 [Dysosmobacter welbionis]